MSKKVCNICGKTEEGNKKKCSVCGALLIGSMIKSGLKADKKAGKERIKEINEEKKEKKKTSKAEISVTNSMFGLLIDDEKEQIQKFGVKYGLFKTTPKEIKKLIDEGQFEKAYRLAEKKRTTADPKFDFTIILIGFYVIKDFATVKKHIEELSKTEHKYNEGIFKIAKAVKAKYKRKK